MAMIFDFFRASQLILSFSIARCLVVRQAVVIVIMFCFGIQQDFVFERGQ